MNLEDLKNAIQSCNINFLIGSGLSRPFLITLGNIETLLDALEKKEGVSDKERNIIKLSLYKIYLEEVMLKNLPSYTMINDDRKNHTDVLTNYKTFLQNINSILLFRYIPMLNKQVNLFTTNIDLFFEKALEETTIEFNDGFKGRLNPIFSLTNFQKSYRKTSLHYKNTSEIPVFNLMKLHGSVNWKQRNEDIVLSDYNEYSIVQKALAKIPDDCTVTVSNSTTIDELIAAAQKVTSYDEAGVMAFLTSYADLQIVNPTKEKFKTTLLNTYYYELLRLFANELEKENTLLFVLGFSFADEHIREITLRAASSNPTLKIFVIAFNSDWKTILDKTIGVNESRIINNNVHVIDPATFIAENKEESELSPFVQFDFAAINQNIFSIIQRRVEPSIRANS